jgi:hypothetical protein
VTVEASAAAGDAVAPLVSVIVATYNRSSVLRHAVASVLGQTFTDFELLVVGDACSDDSEQVVAAFGDQRIRWHDLERNTGSQAGPNNRGLELARGRYVAYLGHDDLWLPGHLGTLVDRLDDSAADFAFSLALVLHPDGARALSGLLLSPFGAHDVVPPTSLMHRRDVVDRIGPWPDPRAVEQPVDEAWEQRARQAGHRFVCSQRLTAIKFPSTLRPGSYLRREDDEQARWRLRIENEPDLEAKELVGLLGEAVAGRLARIRSEETYAPPGWRLQHFSVIRGLAAGVREMHALPAALDAGSFPLAIVAAPTEVTAGSTFRLEVTLENRSEALLLSAQPHPVHLSYRWRLATGALLVATPRRSVLAPPLAPGAAARYVMEVLAPVEPGRYRFEPLLVQELVRWFDQPAAQVPSLELDVLEVISSS